MAKQTPPQYLRQHEDILSERDTTPLDPEELNPLEINENGKRKASSEGMRYNNLNFISYLVLFTEIFNFASTKKFNTQKCVEFKCYCMMTV